MQKVKETAKKPLHGAAANGPGPGRPKGLPNKTTALLKDAILKAAEGAGGKEGLIGYLQQQAKKNPGPFMALLGKVLPLTLAGDGDAPIQHKVIVELVRPPQRK